MKATALPLAAALVAVAFAQHACADAPPELSRKEIETIVRQYVQKHPDVIRDSIRKLQQQELAQHTVQMKKAAAKYQARLTDANAPSVGDASAATVTITEFYDFHCGFCKRMVPVIARLIQEDQELRFVFKDYPLLSADSELAARASLAFYRLNKENYFDFYSTLMQSTGQFDDASLQAAAAKYGVAGSALKQAMDDPEIGKALQENKELAKLLSITGTPVLYVGTEVVPSATTYEQLKELINKARKKGTRDHKS